MTVHSFTPRSEKDEAVSRQDLVNDLHERLKGVGDLKAFPTDFKLVLEERVWEKERVLAGGAVIEPITFHEFIHSDYPRGIDANYDVIERLIGGRPDVLAVWTEVTKRQQGERADLVYNIHDVAGRPAGTSAAAGLRKLQKAALEGNEAAAGQLAEAVDGKKSVHRACVDAGVRKSTRIDRDVKQRCDRAIAEWIVGHAGANDDLSPIVADLFAAGYKGAAIEIKNLIGESVMDRRYG
jgi:hypothetical protein